MEWCEDSVYIKQCEKAEEIQTCWKLLKGDWFYNKVHRKIMVFPYSYSTLKQLELKIWLPRQDQLQEMIKHSDIYFWDLCKEPEGWLVLGRDVAEERIYPEDSLDGIKEKHYSNTAEQALIKAVMFKYNKVWNGKDWISS